jgi:hypothetical protein
MFVQTPRIIQEAAWAPEPGLQTVDRRKATFPCRESNLGRPACSPSLSLNIVQNGISDKVRAVYV